MESLLRWGIQNSSNQNDPSTTTLPQPRTDLDPAIIDHILGKSDAVLMKESLQLALDPTLSEERRVGALDDLEMLVENIDNATDLEKLKIWEPLQSLLTSPENSESIKTQTLWVIGTALQNNPAAQIAYLTYNPFPTLLPLLSHPSPSSSRSKALYALSGLLKHNTRALQAFDSQEGSWDALKGALEDPDIGVRRKAVFLLNTLITPTSVEDASTVPSATNPAGEREEVHPNTHASMLRDPNSLNTSPLALTAIKRTNIMDVLLAGLLEPVPFGEDGDGGAEGDPDFEEKTLRFLHTFAVDCQQPLTASQKSGLGKLIEARTRRAGGTDKLKDQWGLNDEELEALEKCRRV